MSQHAAGAGDAAPLPFIDAHHHFWDLPANPHPWLLEEPMIPFRYGDYSSIRKTFMPEDYDRIALRQNVIATITMEAEWTPDDPFGESRWLAGLRERTGRPAAHVAQAWLDAPDLEEVLAFNAGLGFVRSVRHKPKAAPRPDLVEKGAPGSMSDPAFRRGFVALARHGLAFDLQVHWWHLGEAVEMAALAPEIPIILNHTGLPADRSAEGLAGWRAALARFAELPQAALKLSGIGLKGRPWRLEDNERIIKDAIEIMGPSRCMIASNFPVDGVCGDFDTIIGGFRTAIAGFTEAEQRAMLAGNAVRIYRLDPAIAAAAGCAQT